jgi:hypothetical protein
VSTSALIVAASVVGMPCGADEHRSKFARAELFVSYTTVFPDVPLTGVGYSTIRGLYSRAEQRGTMGALTSFETDIRPLFTQRDIQGMSKAFNIGVREGSLTAAWRGRIGLSASESCRRTRYALEFLEIMADW